MSMKLYEISAAMLDLQSIEVGKNETLAEAIATSMEDVQMDFNEKLDNMVKMTLNNDSHIAGIDAEVKRLQDRKKSMTIETNSIKAYILHEMQAIKRKTIKTALYTLTDALGKTVVKIDDENKIPSKYINVTMSESPDKRELLKALGALEEGESIAGCHADKSPNTLRIK